MLTLATSLVLCAALRPLPHAMCLTCATSFAPCPVLPAGDAYVVAGNLVCHDRNHAATILRFALRAQQEAARVPRPDVKDGTPVQLRIGELVGTVVAIRASQYTDSFLVPLYPCKCECPANCALGPLRLCLCTPF